MALDEAILETTTEEKSLPTLRLYSWSPPCLSLGHAQPISQIDLDRLKERNWSIVRRPTGGRAILHADELTYSVAAPINNPHLAGGVLESYKKISQGLVRALQILNVEIAIQPEVKLSSDEREQAICFELPSSYEITARGKKLIGSAQVRRRGGVLQHGSLPLGGDLTRICQVLSYPDDEQRTIAASRLRDRATTLEEILGFPISWQDVANAMVEGFKEGLHIHLEPMDLSKEELAKAERLCKEKHELQDWVENR